MLRQQLAAASVLVLLAAAGVHAQTASDPAAGWRGVKVLPKLNAVVKVGNTIIDDNNTPVNQRLSIPWVVQDVNGAWLWVGDSRKGWVQWTEVVTLDQAPQYYTDFINRGEQKAWAYHLRATAWYEKGELDLAIADYGERLRLDPDAVAYNNRGNAWSRKKEYDKAIADYNQAIRLDPNDAMAYNNRGEAWRAKKEYDRAIADYNQAIRLDPNYAVAYNNRGSAWLAKKEYDKAIADYTQAIRLDPNAAMAYNNRGFAWSDKKEYDRAIADYDQAIRLDPNHAMAYNNRGFAWSRKKEYDKAVADYNQAIRLDPNDASAYSGRGFAWEAKKEYDKAIADYNQAIRLDPNDAWACNQVAWLQATCPDAHCRDGKAAVTMATKACELSGWTVANNVGTLGTSYAEAGDFDQAIKWQQKAIDLNSRDAEFVKGGKERLELYRQKKPYRE